MSKLLSGLLVVMLIVGPAMAMGGGRSRHNSVQQTVSIVYRESGPIFRAFSEFATVYIINIDDVAHIQEADEDGFLDFNLFPLKLPNGKHLVKITPTNIVGEAPSVEFNLQISGKNPQLWQIVPNPKLIKSNPEYKNYFSEDLQIFVQPQR